MLLVSDYDVVQGVERWLIIGFSLALVIAALIIGVYLLSRTRSSDLAFSKNYFLGLGFFAILLGAGRLVLLYHDYFAPDELDVLLWKAGSALVLVGLTFLALMIEQYIFQKTKRMITIIGLACTIVLIVFPKDIATVGLYVGNVATTLLPFFIYIYIAKISTGKVRANAIYIVIGMVLTFVGQFGGTLLFNFGVLDRVWSQLFGVMLSFFGLLLISVMFTRIGTSK